MFTKLEKHGHCPKNGRPSPEYRIWVAMIARCEIPSAGNWHRYGGRGIRVCARWRKSFSAFLADMGPKPADKTSLDRINNDGNYTPRNCRWATASEQRRNMPDARLLTFRGKTACLSQWARDIGLSQPCLHARIVKMGWPVGRALTQPADRRIHAK